MSEMPSKRMSLGRLLAKWTGITYIRRKYSYWRAKRVIKDLDYEKHSSRGDSAVIVLTEKMYAIEGHAVDKVLKGLTWFDSFSTGEESTGTLTTGIEEYGVLNYSPTRITDGEVLQKVLKSEGELSRAISEVSAGQYIFQRLLGVGSFSKVKLAIDNRSGEKVAIKMIDAQEIRTTPRLQQTLLREVEILRRVRHPNVVEFKEATIIKEMVCLVMNYVPGSELFHYVAEKRRLEESETRLILRQVLLAIDYLHCHGIVHRDLKLENILVETTKGGPKVTLIDFGLAQMFRSENFLITRCGSEEYAAPEVILGNPYDGRASDAWSFGVIMYACLIGSLPFNPETNRPRALAEKIVGGIYRLPEGLLSPMAAQIIRGLLIRDPRQRLGIAELLVHPWFSHNQSLSV